MSKKIFYPAWVIWISELEKLKFWNCNLNFEIVIKGCASILQKPTGILQKTTEISLTAVSGYHVNLTIECYIGIDMHLGYRLWKRHFLWYDKHWFYDVTMSLDSNIGQS